jgi:hypothetical protein
MMISPSRMFLLVLVVIASIGQADAQDFQSLFDFLTTFDFTSLFESVCPIITPAFDGFGISLPFCSDSGTDDDGTGDDGTGDDGSVPAPAPTKKGKVVVGTAAPVAPPSVAP